jgi:hypothetical protein
VLLRKFRSTESGAEFSPEAGEWITVDSIIAGAESDPDLAAAVGSLMAYVAKKGIEAGIVAPACLSCAIPVEVRIGAE